MQKSSATLNKYTKKILHKLCSSAAVGFCFSTEINPCLEGNGGCHANADCIHVGPNKVKLATLGSPTVSRNTALLTLNVLSLADFLRLQGILLRRRTELQHHQPVPEGEFVWIHVES